MPELPVLYAAGGWWVVHMQFVIKAVRGLAVLACAGLQWASAAPPASPTQTPTETAAPEEPILSDIGPARGFRGEAQRPVERPVSLEMSTGQKSLDLLLELEGRAGKGNESGNGSAADEARNEAARAARKRLLEAGAPIPEKGVPTALSGANKVLLAGPAAGREGDMREADRDPASEGQRWSAGGEASGAGQDNLDADNAAVRRDYGAGGSLNNTTTRKLLSFLQEYRSWVIAGTVAATLLAWASGRASRTRRRG